MRYVQGHVNPSVPMNGRVVALLYHLQNGDWNDPSALQLQRGGLLTSSVSIQYIGYDRVQRSTFNVQSAEGLSGEFGRGRGGPPK